MTLEELRLENEKLKAQLEDMERRTLIVIRQCDEWGKSDERLLKDFIPYRKTN